jgi:hypothetical protein
VIPYLIKLAQKVKQRLRMLEKIKKARQSLSEGLKEGVREADPSNKAQFSHLSFL